MSGDWKSTVSRRPLLAALGALAGAGVAAGLLYEGRGLLGRRYTGPHAGLLSGLGDVESAAVVGRDVLAQADRYDPKRVAHELHDTIGHRPLAAILTREAARGEVMEVHGWVLPETLVWLCALAAKPS
ncbi:MAG TPA: hypothetical protein VG867_05135 [Rhizomicrobium sp.]|nr:hypothetical protein [Rhizomicrobium sp.]